MPKCAQLLIAALLLLLHQTAGIPTVLTFALSTAAWIAATPAALIAVAAVAFWHLANHHTPTPARARH